MVCCQNEFSQNPQRLRAARNAAAPFAALRAAFASSPRRLYNCLCRTTQYSMRPKFADCRAKLPRPIDICRLATKRSARRIDSLRYARSVGKFNRVAPIADFARTSPHPHRNPMP